MKIYETDIFHYFAFRRNMLPQELRASYVYSSIVFHTWPVVLKFKMTKGLLQTKISKTK